MPLLVGLPTLWDMPWGAMQGLVVAVGGIVLGMDISFSVSQAAGAAVALLAVASTGASAILARRESGVNPIVVTALLSGAAGALLFFASLGVGSTESR